MSGSCHGPGGRRSADGFVSGEDVPELLMVSLTRSASKRKATKGTIQMSISATDAR